MTLGHLRSPARDADDLYVTDADDLAIVADGLVAVFGSERRQQVEAAVTDAWHALRSIGDRQDRMVTAARLARIELNGGMPAQRVSAEDAADGAVLGLTRSWRRSSSGDGAGSGVHVQAS
jgi:hypothetical protein